MAKKFIVKIPIDSEIVDSVVVTQDDKGIYYTHLQKDGVEVFNLELLYIKYYTPCFSNTEDINLDVARIKQRVVEIEKPKSFRNVVSSASIK
jgi:hypothetical protein